MNVWPCTGVALRALEQPVLGVEPFYKVGHGTYLDFQAIPTKFQSDSILCHFLSLRDLLPCGKLNQKVVERLIGTVNNQESMFPASCTKPKRLEDIIENSVLYQSVEQLLPRTENSKVLWTSDWADISPALKKIVKLDEEHFTKIFGKGQNGACKCIQLRLTGGHLDLESLEVALVKLKDCSSNAIAFRIKVTPP